MKELITAVIDGNIIEGYRLITGTRELYQKVYFAGIEEPDGAAYKPSQRNTYMLDIAKLILWQLATGRALASFTK
ncbi:hypothetical protein [Neptunicella sp. SCSIO 80796]|uniref:hypothetical protein n=1 Tax=Neptunicella plasticusilytica TaxID=3117012 RepID=UPI003A4D85C1